MYNLNLSLVNHLTCIFQPQPTTPDPFLDDDYGFTTSFWDEIDGGTGVGGGRRFFSDTPERSPPPQVWPLTHFLAWPLDT